MRSLGRWTQKAALVLLPLAIVLELAHAITLRDMLIGLVFFASLFWLGRMVEGYAA